MTTCTVALGERPSAMRLFPEETLVFVRMANAYEFGQGLRETATGRMLRDPQLRPLVEQLYGDAGRIYTDEAEQRVGLSWDELQQLPRGEVAIGLIARDARRPALLLLVDQGDESSVADRLLERALEVARERGADFSSETVAGVEVTVVRDPNNQDRTLGMFERDGTIVAATDADVLRSVLHHWNENGAAAATRSDPSADDDFVPFRTLADNDRFATILRASRRPQDPPPHLLFYVDPIELVRNVGRNRGGVQFVLGLLAPLGADGLAGLGGTITYDTEQYEDLSHFHLLLENPRTGLLQLPALEAGDTTPQSFVPLGIESYLAWNWNVQTSYHRLVTMVDQFRYEGSVDAFVRERLSTPLGIDFPAEVLDNLAGRFTWLIGYEKPAHFRSQRHIVAAELFDEDQARATLQAVVNKHPQRFDERRFGDVAYYAIRPPGLDQQDDAERPIDPFVAIMDGHLFVGGSGQLFERSIAARDGTADRLADSDDYRRVLAVIGRETAGTAPALVSMSRYEETVRHWYELLRSEHARELIDQHKSNNRFLAALAAALDEHQLPPFEVLAAYFAPSGMVVYDTDTGYHAINFTLRGEAP